jgi:hypothetical protein
MSVPRSARIACLALLLLSAPAAQATTLRSTPLADLARGAGRIFRGHCVSAIAEEKWIAGARIAVTSYRFSVREHLKGSGAEVIEFRQVGRRDQSRFDLGRIAGLPVYQPGREYVLFLLPESRAGLTSPAGAAEGAFAVHGDMVGGLQDRPSGLRPMRYAELREAVLREVGR